MKVSAGYLELVCVVGTQYGLDRAQLMAAAAIGPEELRDRDATLPVQALVMLLRFVLERTRDQARGMRLAHAFSLHSQGFWGYALMSSQSMRERVAIHQRYQELRAPFSVSMLVERHSVSFDVEPRGFPQDLQPIVLDWGFAGSIRELRSRAPRRLELQLWLSYPEQPHHAELRALVSGPVVFNAPCNRLQLPAAELDRPLPGDPQLSRLASAQLDERLRTERLASGTRERVCLLLRARLDSDPSLDRIAQALGVSSRTLRRRLAALGTTFHELVEELRAAQALAWLGDNTLSINVIARRLGYRDASNFRRAFRRWHGITPSEYRAQQRPALAPNDGSWPALPLPAGSA